MDTKSASDIYLLVDNNDNMKQIIIYNTNDIKLNNGKKSIRSTFNMSFFIFTKTHPKLTKNKHSICGFMTQIHKVNNTPPQTNTNKVITI